jgi:ferredoxin
VITLLTWGSAAILAAFSVYLLISFVKEGSVRAALVGTIFFATITVVWVLLALWFPQHQGTGLVVLHSAVMIIVIMLFVPIGSSAPSAEKATGRFDERDIMFARARYKQGDGKYEQYYADKPDLQAIDDFTRHLPNLGEPGSESFDHLNAPISEAIFSWISRVRETVSGEVSTERRNLNAEEASHRLIGLSRYLGACDAGTTAVGPEHVYSHIGRGSGKWGAEIDAGKYSFALVFTVEMSQEMLRSTPLQPVLADSGRQYLEAAKIAFAIAEYVRMLGYDARAHVDGNYRLIMPTLAMEAGLGEIGRHSLLITPREGSRVRIGAVSTDLPLVQNERIGFGVQDFCEVCRKCQRNCPTNAIPEGDKEDSRGARYWKINPVRCYRYWRGVGTDCGLCVAVCPYSRPKSMLHSFVRTACSASALSRRLFARLDDVFYGYRPRSREYPRWMLAGLTEDERNTLKIH